jgi:hypothetical protein
MSPKERAERRYWERVRDKAAELGTDGCTFATGAFVDCCLEHDLHWRLGTTLDGKPITKREADARFRACMQSRSRFGFFSPVAWWRWSAVRLRGLLT